MPAKFTLSIEQVHELKQMIEDCVPQFEIAVHFNTTDAMIRKFCRDNNIDAKWYHYYTCTECGSKFKATHKTALCPTCKSIPLTCVICGKEFPKKVFPYNQKTCSAKCRGEYRKQSGVAKQGAAKMLETKMERYGTLDPAQVAKQRLGGDLPPKICPLCHKEFIPNTSRQVYCTDIHYGPCPICGKLTEIKDYSVGPQACSEKCRMERIYATNIERYGNKNSVNSEHAKELARKHSLEKYGTEHPMQSDEVKNKVRKTIQERYGVNAPISLPEFQNKAKETNKERYGTEWATQSDDIKKKAAETVTERYGGFTLEKSSVLRENYESTMLEKYGVTAPLQNSEIAAKQRSNNLEKYGTEHAMRSDEANAKRNITNMERYGCENPYGSKEIQEKIRKDWIEKYGGPNPMYSKELVNISKERREATMLKKYGAKASLQVPEIKKKISSTIKEKYGVDWFVQSPECMEHNYHAISEPNKKFAACLNELGLETQFEYYIGRPSFDIHVVGTNLLIEVDPTWSHNSFDNNWHEPKLKDYHLNKTKLAEENGMRCIHVFDWDNKEAILSILAPKQRIYARQCMLQRIDKHTAEQFTANYHLQGSCKGQNIVYGLYYEGELIQIMSFGKPRYTKKYDLELLRLCSRAGVEIVGGASKLFNQFKKDFPESSVLSYCDYAKFSGHVYTQMGMKLSHLTPPAKVWSQGDKYITDNYLRQLGYDKIFHTNYGKGTSNEQLMLEHKWLPVYDCGQKVFVYTV